MAPFEIGPFGFAATISALASLSYALNSAKTPMMSALAVVVVLVAFVLAVAAIAHIAH